MVVKRLVLLLLLVIIHGMMLYNALFHNPKTGYDAEAHLFYVTTLAQGRLPTGMDSYEFFSPPLPYAVTSVAYHYLAPYYGNALKRAVKIGQLMQWLLSIGITIVLLRLCEWVRPQNLNFKIATLTFWGILPVYYKTFAFIRGEPWVLLFLLLAVYEFLHFMAVGRWQKRPYWPAFRIGLWLGLAMTSRQWAIFAIITIAIFILKELWGYASAQRQQASHIHFKEIGRYLHKPFILACFIMTLTTILVGSWFYVHLYLTYGSATAFNTPAESFSFANQPATFYTDLALDKLFTDPVRPMFDNRFWPQFYTEMWGDYFAYFIIYGREGDSYVFDGRVLQAIVASGIPEGYETNRYQMNRYLGRVNLLALPISLMMLVGFLLGGRYFSQWLRKAQTDKQTTLYTFGWLLISITWIGYGWFLLTYLYENGSTVKATYVLHIFPFLALLAAEFLEQVRERHKGAYYALWGVIVTVFIVVIPVCITRYAVSPLSIF